MRQGDLKRMIAYSSINHVSYCLLALFAVAAGPVRNAAVASSALGGAILQMFNHGLSASALFLCIGVLEARGGGRRGIGDFGGVRSAAPVFAGLCGIAMFSSIGLPGLNGFVGEFLIFRGVFGVVPWAAAAACLGLLVTALFYLTFWQRVFHGPRAGVSAGPFPDIAGPDRLALAILVALMFLFGFAPQLLVGLFNPLVTAWVGGLPTP
jgi:NADH-quinone oxidoreductase subunit M